MRTVELDPSEILSGPGQARRVFTGIGELAESIYRESLRSKDQNGILNEPIVKQVAGRWVLTAGERRVRAVRKLVEQGRWPRGTILCKVDEGEDLDSEWKGLIENVQREDVPIWQLGAAFRKLEERGFKQVEIANQIGKSNGYVSRASRMARGIHPDILKQLDAALPEQVGQNYLQRMSEMYDRDTFEPDLERQQKALDAWKNNKFTWSPKTKNTVASMKAIVYKRFKFLKSGTVKIPDHAQPYVEAVLDYLTGAVKKMRWPEEP